MDSLKHPLAMNQPDRKLPDDSTVRLRGPGPDLLLDSKTVEAAFVTFHGVIFTAIFVLKLGLNVLVI